MNPSMSQSVLEGYNAVPRPGPTLPPSPPFAFSEQQPVLPKVGETRCYWTLLSSELEFIYLDPVLSSHLEDQAELLVGKSLLSFVHPDEQTSAKHDLGNVLDSRTLHGSVTRVRFSRLSRIRRQLGYTGVLPAFAQSPSHPSHKIAVDSNYMAVDIVINWASEGLVLCFLHAVVDLTPDDNDEAKARLNSYTWTNWCGTPWMGVPAIRQIWEQLCARVPHQTGHDEDNNGEIRVFQLLGNDVNGSNGGSMSLGRRRPLLMSWPPEALSEDTSQSSGISRAPFGKDLAKLAEEVQIGLSPNGSGRTDGDAKTSCTRRYKAQQSMPLGIRGQVQVESIFIPHGTIIFACHKLKLDFAPRSEPHINPVLSVNTGPGVYPPPSGPYPDRTMYYAQHAYNGNPPLSYDGYLPPDPGSAGSAPYSPPAPPPYSSPQPGWSQVSNLRSNPDSFSAPPWNTAPPNSDTYDPNAYSTSAGPGPSSSAPPSFNNTSGSTSYHQHPTNQADVPYDDETPNGDLTIAVPRRPGSADEREHQSTAVTREQYPPGGRQSGNRPLGIQRCSSCKATTSPEWRKGPSGKKELCNACGLRFARSRAKKDGSTLTQRRKAREAKEQAASESKGIMIAGGGTGQGGSRKGAKKAAAAAAAALREDESPPRTPSSATSSHSDMRRGFLLPGSVSPGSGNESAYQHHHQPDHPVNGYTEHHSQSNTRQHHTARHPYDDRNRTRATLSVSPVDTSSSPPGSGYVSSFSSSSSYPNGSTNGGPNRNGKHSDTGSTSPRSPFGHHPYPLFQSLPSPLSAHPPMSASSTHSGSGSLPRMESQLVDYVNNNNLRPGSSEHHRPYDNNQDDDHGYHQRHSPGRNGSGSLHHHSMPASYERDKGPRNDEQLSQQHRQLQRAHLQQLGLMAEPDELEMEMESQSHRHLSNAHGHGHRPHDNKGPQGILAHQ